MLRSALTTLCLVTAIAASAHADCMPARLQAYLVTTSPVPAGRPLLVALRQSYDGAPRSPNNFPDLALRSAGVTIPLRAEPLAPMLARYVPSRAPAPGTYELVGLGVDVQIVPRAESPGALRPPRVRAVQRRAQAESYGATSLAMRIVLRRPAPAGALALVVRGPGGVFAQAALQAGTLEYTIFSDGDCEETPRGRIEPPALGTRVQVSYVGADGVVGGPAEIAITQG